MSYSVAAFVAAYLAGLIGSVCYHPLAGVLTYTVVYTISPTSRWWGVSLSEMGLRLSLFAAIAIGVGMLCQRARLRYAAGLHSQEALLFLFVALVWLSIPLGLPSPSVAEFAGKLTKVALFLWMFGRIVSTLGAFDAFVWTLLLTGLYMGWESRTLSATAGGRIHVGVGGSDFAEGNFLAAHLAILLPFAGIQFFRSGWKGKALCLVSGAVITNGIVMCRSRGVFVAIIAGVAAAVATAPAGMRRRLFVGVAIALVGASFLVDPAFWQRMGRINTDVSDVEGQDDSSRGRILAWGAAMAMVKDHPLGIGQGNFKYYVGDYQPLIPGKDTHNTYLRCLAELGIQGFAVYLAMIVNAFLTLRRAARRVRGGVDHEPYRLLVHATGVALVMFLTAGVFITHTYIEELYWLLLLPVVLQRVIDNALREPDLAWAGGAHGLSPPDGRAPPGGAFGAGGLRAPPTPEGPAPARGHEISSTAPRGAAPRRGRAEREESRW